MVFYYSDQRFANCEMWSTERSSMNLYYSPTRWLWYAWEPRLKSVIAHPFGGRDTATFRKLAQLLKPFNIRFYCTDNFRVYHSEIPSKSHITGKIWTQRIERNNLNLRTRIKRLNRKTIGFSKCADMHDKVIGTFIEREFY